MSELTQCTFITKAGTQCRLHKLEDSEFCRMHKFQSESLAKRSSQEEVAVQEESEQTPKKAKGYVVKRRGYLESFATYSSTDAPKFYDSLEINLRTREGREFNLVLVSSFIRNDSDEIFAYTKNNYVKVLTPILGAIPFDDLVTNPKAIMQGLSQCHESLQKHVQEEHGDKEMAKYFTMIITRNFVVHARNDTNIGVVCNGEGESDISIILESSDARFATGFTPRDTNFKYVLIASDTLKNGESSGEKIAKFVMDRQNQGSGDLLSNPYSLVDELDLIFLHVYPKKAGQASTPVKTPKKAGQASTPKKAASTEQDTTKASTKSCEDKIKHVNRRFLTMLYNNYSGNMKMMSKLQSFNDTVKALALEVVQELRSFTVGKPRTTSELEYLGRFLKLHLHDLIVLEILNLIDNDNLSVIYLTRL